MSKFSATEDLLAGVRKQCAALSEVTEGLAHGAPTWFVRGRRSFVKFIDPGDHRLEERHVAFWAAAPPVPDTSWLPPTRPGSSSRRSAAITGWACDSTSRRAVPTGTKSARSSSTPTARLSRRPSSPDWIPRSDAELALPSAVLIGGPAPVRGLRSGMPGPAVGLGAIDVGEAVLAGKVGRRHRALVPPRPLRISGERSDGTPDISW